MLLTTHYIEEAHALCGRIAFIRDGRLLAEGAADAPVARFGGANLEAAYLQAMRP